MWGIFNAITLHAFVAVVALLGIIITHFTHHADSSLDAILFSIITGASWGAIQRQKPPVDHSIEQDIKDYSDGLKNDR